METKKQHICTVRPRILFVDDSKLMRLSGGKILSESFDVVLAENADQARQMLEQDPTIQLMFSDLNMPGQSGYELLAELRASSDQRLSTLPIIIVTGTENQEVERQRALKLGATDFIGKPFRASELTARARAHATHEEAARRLRRLEDAHHLDAATRLGNRRYCTHRLDQAMSFARRHDQSISLIHLQLHGLTALLEELGNPFAGSALTRIGRVLAEPIRREDMVFRVGPESFLFVLPATNSAGAEVLRKRFIPDLQALGLVDQQCLLAVDCRFAVHSTDPRSSERAESMIASILAEQTRPAHDKNQTTASDQPDLELALEWIQNGQAERLGPHLAHLMARLQPLLDIAGQNHSEAHGHAGSLEHREAQQQQSA